MDIGEYYRELPQRAVQELRLWTAEQLTPMTDEQIEETAARYARQWRLHEHPVSGDLEYNWATPGKPSDGVAVTIPFEGGPGGLPQFFELVPSVFQRVGGREPQVSFNERGAVFHARTPEQAEQFAGVLRHNIDQRNREIKDENDRLSERLAPVVRQKVDEVRASEGAALARWSGFGLPDPFPLDPASGADVPSAASESGESSPTPPELTEAESSDENVRRSYTSELVGADTRQRARSRALNLVEELAGSLLAESEDGSDEQLVAQLALCAVSGLRLYVDTEDDPTDDRAKAWRDVAVAAIALVPKGREGLALGKALADLATAYGLRLPFGG